MFKNQEKEIVMFQIEQNHIVIPMPPSQEYNIPLNKCNTLENILGWVIHLLEKDWVTKDIVDEFIETALKEHNLTRPPV